MEIKFIGAADTVTGSRTLLRFKNKNLLIDCGLFQGARELRERNREPFPIGIKTISAIFLTHAHIDHCGYLPRLVKEGYRGPIFCSKGTGDLLSIMLYDTAHLEEEFASYSNTTGHSKHRPALPLFTRKDVDETLKLVVSHDRYHWVHAKDGFQFRFLNAGHIIGASLLQFQFAGANPRTITFSGDLGNERLLTLKGPDTLDETDVLVLESTYGNRLQEREDLSAALAKIVNRTVSAGGCLLIPSFAVGRAQEILYRLRVLEDHKMIPKVPVILDSPMSENANKVFFQHPEDHRVAFTKAKDDVFLPHHFQTSTSTDESMMTTMRDGPLVTISAAGMLNGGRVLHHLKKRLPDPNSTILFVGYQAEGSKGRYLQDHAAEETLRVHHQEVPINAEIATLHGLSSHADYEDTLNWLAKMRKLPETIFLNHGSDESKQSLAEKIEERFGIVPIVVAQDMSVDLSPKRDQAAGK